MSDDQLIDFKLQALEVLTPHASAVLIDREFGWAPAIERRAVAPNCGLIASADQFPCEFGRDRRRRDDRRTGGAGGGSATKGRRP